MKKFTLLELANLVDKRLFTSIDDFVEIFNHIFQESFMIHHLPTASDLLKENKPLWFIEVEKILKNIKLNIGTDDFLTLHQHISDNYFDLEWDIEPFSATAKANMRFEEYMIENSLLKNFGKNNV